MVVFVSFVYNPPSYYLNLARKFVFNSYLVLERIRVSACAVMEGIFKNTSLGQAGVS
jgi:hypothetical protein